MLEAIVLLWQEKGWIVVRLMRIVMGVILVGRLLLLLLLLLEREWIGGWIWWQGVRILRY